jgi:hypothetical protein
MKKKSQKAENKNTKCTKQKCKQLFIMLKYKNINTERNKQSYRTGLYFKLMLNKPNIMEGCTFFYTFLKI